MSDSTELPNTEDGVLSCAHCGWEVRLGPQGGYVCPQCFHTETPDTFPA